MNMHYRTKNWSLWQCSRCSQRKRKRRLERIVLALAFQKWQQDGGALNNVPVGARTKASPKSLSEWHHEHSRGEAKHRCAICDFSSVNPHSIANPAMALRKARNGIDRITGDPICGDCTKEVGKFLSTKTSWRAVRDLSAGERGMFRRKPMVIKHTRFDELFEPGVNTWRQRAKRGQCSLAEAERNIEIICDQSRARFDIAKSNTSRRGLRIDPSWVSPFASRSGDNYRSSDEIVLSDEYTEEADEFAEGFSSRCLSSVPDERPDEPGLYRESLGSRSWQGRKEVSTHIAQVRKQELTLRKAWDSYLPTWSASAKERRAKGRKPEL